MVWINTGPKRASGLTTSPMTGLVINCLADNTAGAAARPPIADTKADNRRRALGLIARTTLIEEESAAIGRLLRDKLSDPFSFLKPEFDWAFANTEPAEALAKLAQRF